MNRLIFSPTAAADIDGIWDYTADRWGVVQANTYTDQIQTACRSLARGNTSGRPSTVRDEMLKQAVGRHMIYFKRTGDEIEIIRILHQGMDVDRHL